MNIHIIGCGATGSHLAPLIAAVAPTNSTIILQDFDTFESKNLVNQNVDTSHIGRNKAEAVAELCDRLRREDLQVLTRATRATRPAADADLLCLLVDSFKARAQILRNAPPDLPVLETGISRDGARVRMMYASELLPLVESAEPEPPETRACGLPYPEVKFFATWAAAEAAHLAARFFLRGFEATEKTFIL